MKPKKKLVKLFEFVVALAMIVILPVLALSDSKRTDIKSKQSEAKMMLKQIYTMQKAYKLEKGVYWITSSAASGVFNTAFASIRIEIPMTARYSYTITSTDAGATNFTATATSGVLDEDASIDVWVIDRNGFLRVTIDDAIL